MLSPEVTLISWFPFFDFGIRSISVIFGGCFILNMRWSSHLTVGLVGVPHSTNNNDYYGVW